MLCCPHHPAVEVSAAATLATTSWVSVAFSMTRASVSPSLSGRHAVGSADLRCALRTASQLICQAPFTPPSFPAVSSLRLSHSASSKKLLETVPPLRSCTSASYLMHHFSVHSLPFLSSTGTGQIMRFAHRRPSIVRSRRPSSAWRRPRSSAAMGACIEHDTMNRSGRGRKTSSTAASRSSKTCARGKGCTVEAGRLAPASLPYTPR